MDVIEQERPDAVLVELDPERVVRLTKEYAMTNPDQDFGADFLSAIQGAQDMDIPLFLGDEYTQATKARFLSTLLAPAMYSPQRLWAAVFPPQAPQINILQTFLQDPRKVLPLATSLGLSFLLVVPLLCLGQRFQSPQDTTAVLQVLLSIFFSALVSTKVFHTLIADRDGILASKASKSLQAARVAQSLKRKETIRKTWRFTVDGTMMEPGNNPRSDQEIIPLFTLKTPLQANAIRTLNLFEPRWLAMIDSLNGNHDPRFGCVSCTNKFYSVVQTPDGREGRYADVLFEGQGRMAQLRRLPEGSRPSGARKVHTQIQGEAHSFALASAQDVLVSPEGYLVAPKDTLVTSSALLEENPAQREAKDDTVKIVVVVGLLHANGVLELLRQSA